MAAQALVDRFGRVHDYLRLSVTPHCNLRCTYCMPMHGEHPFLDKRWMSADEIVGIASEFVDLGVTKIRLTGGEPLVRKDIRELVSRLSALPIQLSMTTNGVRLDMLTDLITQGALRSVNVSLDTLRSDRYIQITKRDAFDRVFAHLRLLQELPVRLKLNIVVMRGVNDDEITEFVRLTADKDIEVRFIEYMPFNGNGWELGAVMSSAELLGRITERFDISKLADAPHDTGRKYRVCGHTGTFAVISTMTEPFCSGCNRLRLTADGKMKNCLFSKTETDLLTTFRSGLPIAPLVMRGLRDKAAALGDQLAVPLTVLDPSRLTNRSMVTIGG